MITSVELNNFLSHRKNIINFDHGVTVLVGHNGAGKSAIMDAIIFSMFGEKRRDSVEKLKIKHMQKHHLKLMGNYITQLKKFRMDLAKDMK